MATSTPRQNLGITQSSFLTLPPEVRLEIYRYLLVLRSGDICVGTNDTHDRIRAHGRQHTAILQTCRLIREEALSILWGENCVNIDDEWDFSLKVHYWAITDLTLDFDITTKTSGSLDFPILRKLTVELTALRHLEFEVTTDLEPRSAAFVAYLAATVRVPNQHNQPKITLSNLYFIPDPLIVFRKEPEGEYARRLAETIVAFHEMLQRQPNNIFSDTLKTLHIQLRGEFEQDLLFLDTFEYQAFTFKIVQQKPSFDWPHNIILYDRESLWGPEN
ncbi:MAG: hypothetical protein Q9227_003589 [Pyrenula ochraceoflavens]